MTTAILQLDPVGCPSCMQKIKRHVETLDGVKQDTVKMVFNVSKLAVKYDPNLTSAGRIKASIEQLGYDVVKIIVREAVN